MRHARRTARERIHEPREVASNCRVVFGRHLEGLGHQAQSVLVGDAEPVARLCVHAADEALHDSRIIVRIHHHDDPFVVLGGGASHGWSADVDLRDGFVVLRPRRHRGLKGVQVDDHHVKVLPATLDHGGVVFRCVLREDAGQDTGVQGLEPAVQALGHARDLLDVGHHHSFLAQGRGRAAGGDDLPAERCQSLGEVDDSVLVRDTDENARLSVHWILRPDFRKV